MQKEFLIDLADAVVAIRQPDGKVNLKQSINLMAAGAASGGLSVRSGAPCADCCSSILWPALPLVA